MSTFAFLLDSNKEKLNSTLKQLFAKDGGTQRFHTNRKTERIGIYTSLVREKISLDTIDFEIMKKVATSVAFSAEKHRKKFGCVV